MQILINLIEKYIILGILGCSACDDGEGMTKCKELGNWALGVVNE